MALSSLQLVEKLRRLDRELTHCKRQKALRDLLKIILLGFFLYRDVDLRISDIHKRMRTLCEPIEKDIFEAEHEFKQLLESERALSLDNDTKPKPSSFPITGTSNGTTWYLSREKERCEAGYLFGLIGSGVTNPGPNNSVVIP